MSELPAGTVTLVFTDVEGSTRLLQELGRDLYVEMLEAHRRLLRESLGARSGVEVEMQGDSFHFAFARVEDAVAAAVDVQRALAEHAWPAEPIRVRIGLHTGTPVVTGPVYAGLDVHRAARIMQAGHGGQVLLSAATAALADAALPAGVEVVELGEHRLKDLHEPEPLVQLRIRGLPDVFPPLRTDGGRPNNLPSRLTDLLGREANVAETRSLLERTRIVTITGTAGLGKTRLALRVGADLLDAFRSGVFFCDLSTTEVPDRVPFAIAAALSAREQSGKPLEDALVAYLESKEMLLVLDNFEHVLAAARFVGDLLRRCPKLKVLVTSREPLRIEGECVVTIEPLARQHAVALFIQRARQVGGSLPATPSADAAIDQICASVDDVPLGVELAAARTTMFAPEALVSQITDRLKILTGGLRDVPRQRTLRAAIDWSHDLLDAEEQLVFRQVAVFNGGWTLDAAEGVVAATTRPVVDVLGSLVAKSLVRVDVVARSRFSMLEMIRDYGLERLEQTGESSEVAQRHAEFFAAYAEETDEKLDGPDQETWLGAFEREHANLRSAILWALESEHAELAYRLGAATGWYFFVHGRLSEGRDLLAKVLAAPEVDPATRAVVHARSGALAMGQCDFESATAHYADAVVIRRRLGDDRLLADALNNLATPALMRGDAVAAEPLLEESLALARACGNEPTVASATCNLGLAALAIGDAERARVLLEESLAMARALGHSFGCAVSLENLSQALLDLRRFDDARVALEEALRIYVDLGQPEGIASAIENAAMAVACMGRPLRAARLFGTAGAVRSAAGAERPPLGTQRISPVVAMIEDALTPAEYRRALDEGAAVTDPHAEAVDALVEAFGTAPSPVGTAA